MSRMERQSTPLKIISLIDLVLAIIFIIYGIILLVAKVTDYFLEQKDEDIAPTGQPIVYTDTQLTKAVYITILIMAMIVVHSAQAFMALLLLRASKRIIMEPLKSCRKFKLYLGWCLCLLVLLLIGTIVYAAVMWYFLNWLIFASLIVQIVFRVICIGYVQLCRREIRKQFLQSEVPWINPSLPTTL